MTRCKFRCNSVTKTLAVQSPLEYVYQAEFTAVTCGSKENENFFKWTPSGSLKIGVYKNDIFQPGKEYYIDISECN